MVARLMHEQPAGGGLLPVPAAEVVGAVHGIQDPLEMHRGDLADDPVGDHPPEHPVARRVAVVERHPERARRRPGRVREQPGAVGRGRHRLLQDDVAAGPQRLRRVPRMGVIRRGHEDRVRSLGLQQPPEVVRAVLRGRRAAGRGQDLVVVVHPHPVRDRTRRRSFRRPRSGRPGRGCTARPGRRCRRRRSGARSPRAEPDEAGGREARELHRQGARGGVPGGRGAGRTRIEHVRGDTPAAQVRNGQGDLGLRPGSGLSRRTGRAARRSGSWRAGCAGRGRSRDRSSAAVRAARTAVRWPGCRAGPCAPAPPPRPARAAGALMWSR